MIFGFDIQQIVLSAIVTSVGLIIITEFWGKRRAKSINMILLFVSIARFLLVLLRPLFDTLIDVNNSNELSSAVFNEMLPMLPAFIISSYIGSAVGGVVFGIYKWVTRPFRIFKPKRRRGFG